MEQPRSFLTYLFYFVLILTWGSSFILMKYGLQYYTPPQVATIRQVSALIILSGFAVFHIRKIPVNKLGYVALSGLLVMFIPAYLFCYAEAGMSSAIAGILNALTPGFTLLIGSLFFHQQIKRIHIAGLLIGFAGIAMLILVNPSGQLVINHFAFFVIAATICYGFNINIVKTYLSDLNPLHVTTVSVSIAGILSLMYLLATGDFHFLPLTAQNKIPLIAAVTLGVLGTAMAQLLFNQVIKRSSALFASTIIYALPIVAVFWGVLDGEVLVFWHYAGMLLIIISIIVIKQPNLKFLKRSKASKSLVTTLLLITAANSQAQIVPVSAYPKVTGYFSVLYPAVTITKDAITSNFKNGYSLAFPFGINILKSDKFGVSFELTPVIRTQNGTSKVSAVLFNPGALFRFSNGFSYTQRIGFETSGRFGFSSVFNKVIKREKDYSFFTSIPIPVRFGNNQPASIGAGLLFGISF